MDEFLINLLTLSLGGGVVGVVLMGLARLTRSRYGARWRCVVWALLCLRMIWPLPLFPAVPSPIQITAPELELPAVVTSAPVASPEEESFQSPMTEETVAENNRTTPSLSQVVTMVWALGATGVLAWSIVAHLRLCRYLRRWAAEVSREDVRARYAEQARRLNLKRVPRLLECPGLSVPMLSGVFSPVLLLPLDLQEGEMLEYAMLHELIHHRRRDIWLKVLAVLAVCVHWFNPLVWWTARQVERDMELACDETALTVLPQEQHLAYGETILRAAAQTKNS